MNAARARALVDRQIARNPATITLQRMAEVDDRAGGTYRVTVSVPPQAVRIFMTASSSAKDAMGVGGHVQIQRWGLLASWDADIREGDTFTHGGRLYRVHALTQVSTGGEVTAIQAELEEVG